MAQTTEPLIDSAAVLDAMDGVTTTAEVAGRLDVHRDEARRALCRLAAEGRVERIDVARWIE